MSLVKTFGSGRHRVQVDDPYSGRVARLVLQAPEGNALTLDLLDALRAALDEVSRWPGITVLQLEGEGDDFCTGFSSHERRQPYFDVLLPAFHEIARQIARLEAVVVVGLQGRTFGAGLELALLGHWLVADGTARFGFPDAVRSGLPTLGALLLPDRIGRTRADLWLLTGRVVPAREALETGLVTEFTGGWESLASALVRVVDGPLAALSRETLAGWTRGLRPELERRLGPELDLLERLALAQKS
jgi:enoyl-CoA hydratase/carnithine racemase